MALQKTPIQINFARGLDQKTDPLQVQPGRFLDLKNRVFNKMGRLDKRNGYDDYSKSTLTPSGSFTFSQIPASMAEGRNISNYGFTDELVAMDGLNLYSHSTAADNWVYKGRVENCAVSKSSIFKNQLTNLMPDSALNPSTFLNVYAWESWSADPLLGGTAQGVQVSSINSTNGMTVLNSSLASTTSRPKVVSVGSKLYIVYYDTSGTRLKFQPITQSGFGSSAVVITDIDTTTPNYDTLVVGSTLYIGYNGTGSTVKVKSYDSSLNIINTVSKAETAGNGIGLFSDTSNNVWVAYNNGSETKAFIMDSALTTTVLAPTVVDNSSAAGSVKNVTGVYDGTRGVIFYDKPGGPKTGQPFGSGANVYAVTSSFVQPAVGSTVSVSLGGLTGSLGFGSFTHNNSIVYVSTGGYYYVTGAITGSLGATFTNLGLTGNAAPGATVASTFDLVLPTAGFQNSIVTYNTLTAAGSAGTAATLMRSAYLASKAFIANTDVPHVVLGFDSTLQPTYFACALYNVNSQLAIPAGVLVAKVSMSEGGSVPYRSVLPTVNAVSSGIVQVALPQVSFELLRTSSNTSSTVDYLGVSSAQLDFTTNDFTTLDLGRNLQIGGGLVQQYDGARPTELGFNYYPETVTVTGASGSGGLTAGVYGYKVIYQWIDNNGQTHRSAASPTLSYTIATAPAAFTGDRTNGSAVIINVSTVSGLQKGMAITGTGIPADTYILSIDSTSQITLSRNATSTAAGGTLTPAAVSSTTLTIPTLRMTEKTGVTIAIFRTAVNGTVFFRLDTQYITYPVNSSISTDTASFTDVSPDAEISGNEQLYTASEVENIAPPAATFLTTFKNRAVLIPSENPYTWQFSKQVVNGSPVEFSDEFVKNASTVGGPLIGASTLDDKLILKKANSLYYVTGTGPSPNGSNDDFSDPQFITADAGLLSPRSIAITPVGNMFKSAKGIYLLDRSLQTKYIGKAVEDFNSYTVRGGQLIPKSNQVRFILSNSQCLMYDYYWTDEEGIGQWAVFDPVDAVSDCIYDDLHTYIKSNGTVLYETPGTYLDAGSGISTYFKTGWFNLAGLQGLERFYYFTLLAQYISSHTLGINLYFNYDSATAYAVPTITPSATELEQWRIFPTIQKVQSFQIELTESGATGAGLTMSGLDLLVGVKKGAPTIKAANSAS